VDNFEEIMAKKRLDDAKAMQNVAVAQTPQAPPEPIMKFFRFDHLPETLAAVSQPFCDVANWIHEALPRNAERSVALRKLLEAKDAAVRSIIQ
jgi:hypothetical protein